MSRKKKLNLPLIEVITASAILHVVGLFIVGSVVIYQNLQPEEAEFEAPPVVEEQIEQVTVKLKSMSKKSPPPIRRIAVKNVSDLNPPAIDIDVPSVSQKAGFSGYGKGGSGFGVDLDKMSVDFTDFGYTGAVEGTLEGALFDLKRDKDGKDRNITKPSQTKNLIKDFAGSSWNINDLRRKYYAAENTLYAATWVIPYQDADKAPKAFGAEKEIEPKAIAALYQGTFTPTESGDFRFLGFADDVLLVRIGSRVVLDASWSGGFSEVDFDKVELGDKFMGMPKEARYGDWMKWTAGKALDIKILIGEVPGGRFGAYLLYQKKGSNELKIFATKELNAKEKQRLRKVHDEVSSLL